MFRINYERSGHDGLIWANSNYQVSKVLAGVSNGKEKF